MKDFMADTFLRGDLAVGPQHCLGSLSAKDPGSGRVQSLARSGAACSCTMWWFLSQVFWVTCGCGAVLLSTKYGVCPLWRGQGHVSPVSKSRSWSLPHLFPTYHLLYSLSVFYEAHSTVTYIFSVFLRLMHPHTFFLFLPWGFCVDSSLNHLISSS